MKHQVFKNFILKMLHEKRNVKKYLIQFCYMENFGYLLFKFEINIRKTIPLIESTDTKLINGELALLFNETYKNENILPRYSDILYEYKIFMPGSIKCHGKL